MFLTLRGLGVGAFEGVAVDLALVDCRDCRLVKALDSLSSVIPCNSVSSSTSGLEDSKMFVGKAIVFLFFVLQIFFATS